jgi:hypothetical protein
MRLARRTPVLAPRYARYFSEQRHLDYWIFALLLLVVLTLLSGLFALSRSDISWWRLLF